MSWVGWLFLVPMAAIYIGIGILHFVRPAFFLRLMPPYIPWHKPVVYLSGVIEIVLGILVLIPVTRPWAAWGIVALLIAVFPANVHGAIHRVRGAGGYARLPFQLVLLFWAWCYT